MEIAIKLIIYAFILFFYTLFAQTESIASDSPNQNYPFKLVAFRKLPIKMHYQIQYINHQSSTAVQPMQAWETTPLPSSVSLGMSNVPVLNYEKIGRAETFAATALLDAIYNHGDYISQTCYLQINNGDGWADDEHINFLEDLKKVGVISKEYEHTNGCGGLYNYPNNRAEFLDLIFDMPISESSFSLSDYTQHSEKIFSNLVTYTRNAFDFTIGMSDFYYGGLHGQGSTLLNDVKHALANGHRLWFEFYILRNLDDENESHKQGLYAHYHAIQNKNDAWVLTSEITRMIQKSGDCGDPSHYDACDLNHWVKKLKKVDHITVHQNTVVITGYDDNAIIIDEHGISHQGVLTLRDSRGVDEGDQGDFYMSYDYFKKQGETIEEAYLP